MIVRFGRTVPKGWLPVYSVDTEEEAKLLLAMACETNIRGEYIARELAHQQTIPNLMAFGERLEHVHQQWVARKEPEDKRVGKDPRWRKRSKERRKG